MRYATVVALAFLIGSCATETFEGMPLFGRVHDVSPTDLRTAIRLVRSFGPVYRQIYAIEVVSSSEIHLYHVPYSPTVGQYNLVRRVRGKWWFDGERVAGPPSPFRY
jgi:hypothetical protein